MTGQVATLANTTAIATIPVQMNNSGFHKMTPEQKEEYYRRNPEMRDTAKLLDILKKEKARPNRILLKDFEMFVPLYQNMPEPDDMEDGNRYNAMIDHLTKIFEQKFNLYKEIHIFQNASDTKPILVLPPVFIQLAPIGTSAQDEEAVQLYRKRIFSDIPSRVSQAEAGLYEAMVRSINTRENHDRYAQLRNNTRAQFDEFMRQRYPHLVTSTPVAKKAATAEVNGTSGSYLLETEEEFI